MKRRELIKNSIFFGLAISPFARLLAQSSNDGLSNVLNNDPLTVAGPRKPVTIYNNWSAYDELSDIIPLTEELAMKELDELIRLKKSGVHVDYYVMDAFWFDKDGGYRTWHKERWPNGPDKWLEACKENDIKPGMWFSTNDRIADNDGGFFLNMIPEWKGSESTIPKALCLFKGGYLKHLSETLQIWADKGIKVFKFDFARFAAASKETQAEFSESEIIEKNKVAFIDALRQFRLKNPDVLIIAYNGFGGDNGNTYTPFRQCVESRWLEVFDTLYCGDPRFSDVPAMNIWRSADIYSDHMVRQYELNGIPIHRIDNCGFMIGVAGTCYKRANNAWKGMMILELARGGWVNVYHGNMELLSEDDARWFARVQSMYTELQKNGTVSTFGGLPGETKPYGFMAKGKKESLITVVNPSQAVVNVQFPASALLPSKILYADGGFKPELNGNTISLGPEQMAVIGLENYADEKFSLGIDDSINIPLSIENLAVNFKDTAKNTISGTLKPAQGKDIRIIFQQFGSDKFPVRAWGGAPPKGKNMDEIFKIVVTQGDQQIPLTIQYDKKIWSGLSWAAAEIKNSSLKPAIPLKITCISTEKDDLTLKAEVYGVSYKRNS